MRRKKEVISQQRVMEELAAIGFARATDLIQVKDDKVVLKVPEGAPANSAAAIAGIERTGTGFKIKFYDKMRALELLGEHMGMFAAGAAPKGENNLLEAIIKGTQEEIGTDDIQELQQTADPGNDMVEPGGTEWL